MLAKTKHLFQNEIQVTLWNHTVHQHVTRLSYLEGRIQLVQLSVSQDVELQEVNSCVCTRIVQIRWRKCQKRLPVITSWEISYIWKTEQLEGPWMV